MSRGIHETSATHRLHVAREARNDRVDEVLYLLSLLIQTTWRDKAHIAHVDKPRNGAMMNAVVCVHINDERLVWRITDQEQRDYFGSLGEPTQCKRGLSRIDKMAVLKALATV